MNPKIHSKFRKPTHIVLGLIIFIISSLLIYASIYSSVRYYKHDDDGFFTVLDRNMDSITDGDADVFKAVDKLGIRGTSTITSSDTQYVILTFDGSRSLPMWNETRQFAKDMTAKGKPVHFTYYINPIYLVTKEKAKSVYQPPRGKMGKSLIGYANNEEDVKNRVEQINLAYNEGNEIGAHAVGHFSGSKWGKDEWLQELNYFNSLIVDVQKNNPNVVIQPWSFDITKVIGFRAPELGVNSSMYKALAEKKYLYDTSGMRMASNFPVKDKEGIWHIGLGIIKMKDLHSNSEGVTKTKYVLSMDYNFWMIQSSVKNVATKGTPLWNNYFNEVKNSYTDYFDKNYTGNHAPIVIGHHFSSWNDGVYWEAMKSFAEDVCGKPKVKCVTFREYVDYLNSVTE